MFLNDFLYYLSLVCLTCCVFAQCWGAILGFQMVVMKMSKWSVWALPVCGVCITSWLPSKTITLALEHALQKAALKSGILEALFLISFFILKCWKLSKPKSWSQNHPKALGILAPQQLISTLVSLFQSICLHSSNNLYTDFLYWFSVGWFCRIRILWANHFLRKKTSTSLKLWTWIRWLLGYADFPLQSNC